MPTASSNQQVIVSMLDWRYAQYQPAREFIDNFIWDDEWMSANAREVELASMYLPSDYWTQVIDGRVVGFTDDGRTVLYDMDNDGVFDSAASVNLSGDLMWYGEYGWYVDPSPPIGIGY